MCTYICLSICIHLYFNIYIYNIYTCIFILYTYVHQHVHPYCDSLIFIVSSNVFPPISLTTGIGLRHTPDESRTRCPGGGTAPHTPLKMMPWYTLTQVEFLHTRFACRCLQLASINIWETSSQLRLADASRKRPQHLVVADLSWSHMFTTWATKKMVPFLNPFWRPFIGFIMFYISFCGIHIGMLSSSNGRKGDVWPQGDRAFRKAGGRGAKDSQHLGKERGRPWWHNKL